MLDTLTENEIVTRIRRIAKPDRIILFGSHATGDSHKDSDVDLLVIVPECCDRRKLAVRIRNALARLGMAFDVIVMEKVRFDETKNVPGGISYPANKYGQVIYEDPGSNQG